jgi:hypothetical protein
MLEVLERVGRRVWGNQPSTDDIVDLCGQCVLVGIVVKDVAPLDGIQIQYRGTLILPVTALGDVIISGSANG